jgi:hypothetical protein
MLLRAGIPFEFIAEDGTPQPDIQLIDEELRIEVTVRRMPQIENLRDEIEADLAGTGYQIEMQCAENPVRVTEPERLRLRSRIKDLVTVGAPFQVTEMIESGSRRLQQSSLTLQISGRPSGSEGWVTWDIALTGADLTNHMQDIDTFIRDKLTDEAKNKQAEAAPPC